MRTAEEIALSFGLCTCDEMYKSRNLSAPDCPWHSQSVEEAMIEYATEACREQVRLCLIESGINAPDFSKVYAAIANAPLPELK